MFGFLIKKNFCDGWDNLLNVLIGNLVFLFGGVGLLLLNTLVSENSILIMIAFVGTIVILSILAFAYGDNAANIANFNGVGLLDYFKAIPGVLKDGALFGLFISAVLIISGFSLRYYFMEVQSMIGFGIGCLLVWIDFFIFLAMQWFLPVRSLMKNNFKKCLKKSFILLFDNTGFTVAMAFYNIILLALSVVCIGFFPSMAGIEIANTNALRLLLYKYDYLEEHPELKTKKERRKIPWEELIYEDRQILGPRKLKSFLFPWKEEEK